MDNVNNQPRSLNTFSTTCTNVSLSLLMQILPFIIGDKHIKDGARRVNVVLTCLFDLFGDRKTRFRVSSINKIAYLLFIPIVSILSFKGICSMYMPVTTKTALSMHQLSSNLQLLHLLTWPSLRVGLSGKHQNLCKHTITNYRIYVIMESNYRYLIIISVSVRVCN